MAGLTTYYQLETYDSEDVPDLRDQYNASMYKVDAALNTIANTAAGASTAVNTAVQNAQTALDAAAAALTTAQTAQTTAQAAQATAQTAQGTAETAQTAASAAQTSAALANTSIANLTTRVSTLEAHAPERSDLVVNSTNVSTYEAVPVRRSGALGIMSIVRMQLANALANGSTVDLGTLPEGYRPVGNEYVVCAVHADSASYHNLFVEIVYANDPTQPGRVKLFNRSGVTFPASTPFSVTTALMMTAEA